MAETVAAPRWPRIALWAVLGAGFLLRGYSALHDDGISWPDETYQSLEPAHRLVFGYGLVAWEYAQGARTWVLPGFVAGLIELSRALHLPEPRGYLLVIRFVFCGLGAATAWAAWRLSRAIGTREGPALLAAAFFSLGAPFLYFGARALSETASVLPVTLGFVLLESRRTKAGAALLGLSVLIRLHNALFCAGALIAALVRRDRSARDLLLVLGGFALLFGALDWITWGAPFHSAIVYLRFSIAEGGASRWGTADAGFYARVLFQTMPIPALLLGALSLAGARRAPALFAIAAGFALVHVATPHKELRFLLPVMPLFCALAAAGLDELLSSANAAVRSAGTTAALLAAVTLCSSAARYRDLTFGDLGEYVGERPANTPAYDDWGDASRLLQIAGTLPDLCGLKVEAVHLAWTGGYSHFHKRVPLYHFRGPDRRSGYYNYVIAWRGNAPGKLVAADRSLELRKIADGCRPDPAFSWLLP